MYLMQIKKLNVTFSYLGLLCGNAFASTANILETKTITGAVPSLLHFIKAEQT